MTQNRFYKNTLGLQAQAIVAQFLDISNAGAGQPNYNAFVANALPGALGVYFDDTNLLVPVGGTSLPANANRKYFYAWKQLDGLAFRTTPINCLPTYTQSLFNAGALQISTVTVAGVVATQVIHVRITDTTPAQVPYPSFEYSAPMTGTIAQALTAIAAQINAEKTDPIATASANLAVLTVTGLYRNRTFVVTAYTEVVAGAATDASSYIFATPTKAQAIIGNYTDVKEFETYFIEQQGGVLYSNPGTVPSEFQTLGTPSETNVLTTINYGYLYVKTINRVTDSGATRSYENKAYTIIAIVSTAVPTLAAN